MTTRRQLEGQVAEVVTRLLDAAPEVGLVELRGAVPAPLPHGLGLVIGAPSPRAGGGSASSSGCLQLVTPGTPITTSAGPAVP